MNANYDYTTVRDLAGEVMDEVDKAGRRFSPMNSPHEAAFVIEEEWEEYRQEVFKHNLTKPNRDTRPRQREELIQLAAMCMRAILDTIDTKTEPIDMSKWGNGMVGEDYPGCSECREGQ